MFISAVSAALVKFSYQIGVGPRSVNILFGCSRREEISLSFGRESRRPPIADVQKCSDAFSPLVKLRISAKVIHNSAVDSKKEEPEQSKMCHQCGQGQLRRKGTRAMLNEPKQRGLAWNSHGRYLDSMQYS
ncbi:hypothetical protein Bxe_A3734 [Paraburkholderia xenovorans LB400]|uniref:Uncharacterized protein n=1 Tax=Paraburkholderia xenovorans (strain LB400) TaxID=266265 RepID=Q144I4_PARXL|nr:hypothetical protein Bxe_A3734 [Paraburkholderia xenovorans LB400]